MRLAEKIQVILLACGILCAVFVANILTGGWLNHFGIHPRQPSSLLNILVAPFLHANIGHLLNNLLGLSLFSFLCLLRGFKFYIWNSVFIILVSGILVWLFARGANHLGASGWIFGLWSLSIAQAWFERSLASITIALFVVIFYGGMIFGVLPSNPFVSFESHLFGALAGVLAAAVGHKKLGRGR